MKYDKTKDRAGTDEQFPYPMRLEYDKENDLFVVTVYKLPNTKTEAGIRDLYPTTTWLSDDLNYEYNGNYWRLMLVLEGEAHLSKLYESIYINKTSTLPFAVIRRGGKYEWAAVYNPIRPSEGGEYDIPYNGKSSRLSHLFNLIYYYAYHNPETEITPVRIRFKASLRLFCLGRSANEQVELYGQALWPSTGWCNYRTVWNSNPIEVEIPYQR